MVEGFQLQKKKTIFKFQMPGVRKNTNGKPQDLYVFGIFKYIYSNMYV